MHHLKLTAFDRPMQRCSKNLGLLIEYNFEFQSKVPPKGKRASADCGMNFARCVAATRFVFVFVLLFFLIFLFCFVFYFLFYFFGFVLCCFVLFVFVKQLLVLELKSETGVRL